MLYLFILFLFILINHNFSLLFFNEEFVIFSTVICLILYSYIVAEKIINLFFFKRIKFIYLTFLYLILANKFLITKINILLNFIWINSIWIESIITKLHYQSISRKLDSWIYWLLCSEVYTFVNTNFTLSHNNNLLISFSAINIKCNDFVKYLNYINIILIK